MDNLTHSLVGVLLARTGLNCRAPRATLLAVTAANLPDLDIVSGFNGSLCYLAHHRGFTHALFWAPLVALVPLPLWWLLARKRGVERAHWLWAYFIALAAILSHVSLDFLNIYGLRWKLPFSGAWMHSDLVNIVDVWLWLLLLICTLGPMLARLVYSEIGAARSSGRGMAITGLVLAAAYIAGRAHLHGQAVEILQSRLYQHEQPRQVFALPTAANPWQWNGLVETGRAWHALPVNLFRELDPDASRVLHKPDNSAVSAAVLGTETARVFLDFAQCPLWRITPVPTPEGATMVRIYDLRFGLPDEGAFYSEYLIGAGGQVLRHRFSFGSRSPDQP